MQQSWDFHDGYLAVFPLICLSLGRIINFMVEKSKCPSVQEIGRRRSEAEGDRIPSGSSDIHHARERGTSVESALTEY
jgi:hypothetical protein